MDAGCCNLQDAITLVRLWLQIWRGIPSAFGVLNYTNSDSYEGEFKNGKKRGNGKMLWDDGEYEGEWKDLQDGKGIPPTFFVTRHKREKGKQKINGPLPGLLQGSLITKVTERMAGTDVLTFLQALPPF